MIRRPPRSTPLYSSAASDVYKRQPYQRLHDTLRFGVRGLAEVGTEAVVGGKPDVVGVGDHYPGHGATLQAAHPVGQHHGRHSPNPVSYTHLTLPTNREVYISVGAES